VLIVEIDVATRCAERGRRDRHALLLCAARRGERALGASGLVAGFPCRPRAIRSAPAAGSRALPPKAIDPRLIPGVNSSANCLPASFAASNRVGETSVDSIDGDTSMISITTARLRGRRISRVGPASPTVEDTRTHQEIADGWRHLLGR
jgi:hypothetical protein